MPADLDPVLEVEPDGALRDLPGQEAVGVEVEAEGDSAVGSGRGDGHRR